MTKTEKLCHRLLDERGLRVYNLMPATGYWRTSPFSQSYRWEAWATIEDASKLDYDRKNVPIGFKVYLGSYDTVSECANQKRTLQFSRDVKDPWNHFEVSVCTVIKVAT